MAKKTIILVFSLFIILLSACGDTTSTTKEDNKLTIYTTIYPIQYVIERLAGDTIQIETIYPPGVDAHTYEPTTSVMTNIAESDAFIYLGANLEPFATSIADALKDEAVTFVELGVHEELFADYAVHDGEHNQDDEHDSSDYDSEHTHVDEQEHASDGEHNHDGHSHGDHDPHIWLDPMRMVDMATILKEELIHIAPDNAALMEERFLALRDDLHQLDHQFQQVLDNKEDKNILVAHAAYGYWEQRYGIEQVAVNGITSDSEPSQKDIIRILEQAKQYNLKHMIFEQNVSDTVAKQIQAELGASPLAIHNLAVLTEEDINNEEDYLSLMRKNLDTLDQATE